MLNNTRFSSSKIGLIKAIIPYHKCALPRNLICARFLYHFMSFIIGCRISSVPGTLCPVYLVRLTNSKLACKNIRFSSLFAAGDVSQGGTSATQRQKFHTDDAIQCLHNEFSSHGVPNTNLSNFTCLLVDFGKLLCSSANELQQNSRAFSREDYISTNIDCFVRDSSRLHLTFVAFCLLSVIRKQ